MFGPGSSVVEQARDARAKEKQTSLPFRFMEALRNNIQPHSLPVYQVNRPMEADDHEGGTRKMRHRADPRIKLSQLAQDKTEF